MQIGSGKLLPLLRLIPELVYAFFILCISDGTGILLTAAHSSAQYTYNNCQGTNPSEQSYRFLAASVGILSFI